MSGEQNKHVADHLYFDNTKEIPPMVDCNELLSYRLRDL